MATPQELALGEAALAVLLPERSGPLVVLNDDSSDGPARAWGTDKLAGLAVWLAERPPDESQGLERVNSSPATTSALAVTAARPRPRERRTAPSRAVALPQARDG